MNTWFKTLLKVLLGLALLLYLLLLVGGGTMIYTLSLSANDEAYQVNSYRSDENLGVSIKPNSEGFFVDFFGNRIDFITDEWGRRDERIGKVEQPEFVFFGDSFTEGVDTAVHVYPFRFAEMTGANIVNTGESAIGFAQMLMLADSSLAALRPNYAVVQVSPWLTSRSVRGRYDFGFFNIPAPSFSCAGGELSYHPANCKMAVVDIQGSEETHAIRMAEGSIGNWATLVFTLWMPALNDYLANHFQRLWQSHPPKCEQEPSLEEIAALFHQKTEQLDIQLILLQVGVDFSVDPAPQNISHLKNWAAANKVMYVDADSLLWNGLTNKNIESYNQAYTYMQNGQVVDPHPNPAANVLIAKSLLQALVLHAGSERLH